MAKRATHGRFYSDNSLESVERKAAFDARSEERARLRIKAVDDKQLKRRQRLQDLEREMRLEEQRKSAPRTWRRKRSNI